MARATRLGLRGRLAGLAVVERAKADDTWDAAYAGAAAIEMPDDLAAALAANPPAGEFRGAVETGRYGWLAWDEHRPFGLLALVHIELFGADIEPENVGSVRQARGHGRAIRK